MAESSKREHHLRGGHGLSMAQRSASESHRTRSEDSWIEISSQPSSSSLSSVNDDIITTGLRVQQDPRTRRRRRLRQTAPTHLNITSRAPSAGTTSSQEEYEESESESDRVMTSSNEGLGIPVERNPAVQSPSLQSTASDDDEDEDDKTAINYPINNDLIFTPQPNVFSHASSQGRSQTVPGSYFPSVERPTAARQSSNRHSYPPRQPQHSPYNMISPNYSAAADHDAALRASLSTLISLAGAARGATSKKPQEKPTTTPRISNRPEPSTLRMVPESALREETEPSPPLQPRIFDEGAAFKPTIRRTSTSTTASADIDGHRMLVKGDVSKRKAATTGPARSTSKDRRIAKKQRRASAAYGYADGGDFYVTPTLFTWVVVAGVGVFISALSFTAGYAMGKEAGRMEVGVLDVGEVGGCAKEVGRSGTGLGLKKLRFGSGVRVGA